MNPDVNTVAEPSAATPIQYDAWDSTGKPIVSVKQDSPKKADSATADAPKVEKPEAKAESAAEPGAAKQQESRRKPDAEERISQLTAKNKQLEAELAEARRPKETEKKAEPSSASEQPKELKAPVKPKLSDFTGADAYEKYEEAKDRYYEELSDYKVAKALEGDRVQRAQAEQKQKYDRLLQDAKTRYPDFEEKARPAATKFLGDAAIAPAVKAAVSNNDLALELMYVMAGDEAKFQEFIELAKTDPIAAIEEVGVYKRLIREEQGKAKKETVKAESDKAERPRGEDGKFQKETPVENKQKVPPPPSEIGGRAAVGEDPDKAAARSGNFAAFEAEQTRKLRASMS